MIELLLAPHLALEFEIVPRCPQRLAGVWFGVREPALGEFGMALQVVQDFFLVEIVCAGRFVITVMPFYTAFDRLQTGLRVGVR